jgi:hypothetical protein
MIVKMLKYNGIFDQAQAGRERLSTVCGVFCRAPGGWPSPLLPASPMVRRRKNRGDVQVGAGLAQVLATGAALAKRL